MQKEKKTEDGLFSVFTGYTKGLLTILDIFHHENPDNNIDAYHYTLTRPQDADNLQLDDNIQIDGVLARVIQLRENRFTVSTTKELMADTTLDRAMIGSKVSLGLCALHEPVDNRNYLLEASSIMMVQLLSSHAQPGHEHTWQLNFVCYKLLDNLVEGKHIGLAGSSMTAQNVFFSRLNTYFSVFCGKQTREQSNLNESLPVGGFVNFTEPKFMGCLK